MKSWWFTEDCYPHLPDQIHTDRSELIYQTNTVNLKRHMNFTIDISICGARVMKSGWRSCLMNIIKRRHAWYPQPQYCLVYLLDKLKKLDS